MGNSGSKRNRKVAVDNRQRTPPTSVGVFTEAQDSDDRRFDPPNEDPVPSEKDGHISKHKRAADAQHTPPHGRSRTAQARFCKTSPTRTEILAPSTTATPPCKRPKTEKGGGYAASEHRAGDVGRCVYTDTAGSLNVPDRVDVTTASGTDRNRGEQCHQVMSRAAPGVLIATDGYVSFSESSELEDVCDTHSDGLGDISTTAAYNAQSAVPPGGGNESGISPLAHQNQKPIPKANEVDNAGDNMWNWSDGSSDGMDLEKQEIGRRETVDGDKADNTAIPERIISRTVAVEDPAEPRVEIDRLGRRSNAVPRLSSSSSSDNFEGWDDDTEEDGEDGDDDGDTGEVYDWTAMDTAEGDALRPTEELANGHRRSSGGPSAEESTGPYKSKAEANPLASKLGLSSSAPRVRPVMHPTGQWHGRGRGRGGKPVVPGRGGRPRYSPLLQGQPQFLRSQARPPQGAMAMSTRPVAAGIGGRTGSETGADRAGPAAGQLMSPTTAVRVVSPVGVMGSGERGAGSPGSHGASAVGPPVVGAIPVAVNLLATSAGPISSSSSIPQSIQPPIHLVRAPGAATAGTDKAVTLMTPAGTVTGARPDAGSRQCVLAPRGSRASGSGDHHAATVGLPAGGIRPQSSVSRVSGGAGPPRGTVARPMTTPVPNPAPSSTGQEEVTVKDTANVTRKKAQLPQQEHLEHPTPVGGNWLKNRYIVNNFILLEPLGTGSYAEVRLAKEKTSNKLYAVKIMNKDFLKKRQVGKEGTFMDDIKREIAIMKKVHHPNVLRLYEVMDDPKVNKLYLVLEYCKKGDLMNILNGDTRTVTCDPMNDADVWYIMRQIVQGLSFLHLQNIVHGDIKPQNLLVGADTVAKIADFGISKFVQGSEQRLQEQAGTPTFMSPELCSGGEYSGQLADVWALGATMYMVRCGKPPFVASQVMVLYEKIQNDPLEFPPEVNMSVGLRRLLIAMMKKTPAKRITLEQVASDRWLQQGDFGYSGAATSSSPGPPVSAGSASTAAASHPAIVAGGHGGTGAPGLRFGQRPPPPILPVNQQGFKAIRVSEDEVHQSISGGTTTQRSGDAAAAVAADRGGAMGPAGSQRVGGPFGLPLHQRLSPPINEQKASITTAPAVGEGKGNRRESGAGSGGRGHLSETEETWKYRSFKKKLESVEMPKFRGVSVVEGSAADKATSGENCESSATISVANDAYALAAAKAAAVSTGDSYSEREESDEFSEDEADTLFETGPGTPCGVPIQSNRGSTAAAGCGTEGGGRNRGTRNLDGADVRQVGRDQASRRSSEMFDAVMDTLAAQPRPGRGVGSGPRRSVDDGRMRPARPLRDTNLRGVSVVSSSPGGSNSHLGLIAAASQRQGKRPSQEDRTKIVTDLGSALARKVERPYLFQQFALFGVFDGHNGRLCSEALSDGIFSAIARQSVFHQSPEKALVQAFESFDRDLCARQGQEGDTSGSTAVVVLFDGRVRSLLVANVGDSRCVASKAGVATRLSNDHRLDRPDERERVVASGGFVANNRINGVLAVSRSFGDPPHKEGKSLGLIATPEVASERVNPSVEFLILATDGLWDVIDDQEAVNFVRMRVSENPDLSHAAKELTRHALDEGSVDNVSAVLVWFGDSSSRPLGGGSSSELGQASAVQLGKLQHE